MNATPRKKQENEWPKKVTFGRETVSIYRRKLPGGNFNYLVASYATNKRRFTSYANEAEAVTEAEKLVRQISKRDVVSATLTPAQAIACASALQQLEPLKLELAPAISALVAAVKLVGDLPSVGKAAEAYSKQHKHSTAKPVKEVVEELLAVKKNRIRKGRAGSERYLGDLRNRLTKFAKDCPRDACNITTGEIQNWLDGLKLKPQTYRNYRTVLYTLFQFAVARGYAVDNPVKAVEKVDASEGDIAIYTPTEMGRLLAAASLEFLPVLAIGGFGGLRSAEIERLEWSDIDLQAKLITIGKKKAKTASRRIVPIHDNLAAWLAPYADRTGMIWPGLNGGQPPAGKRKRTLEQQAHDDFYEQQQATARATGIAGQKAVEWKANGLRHSYASYRCAQLGDTGRVAGELGNSKSVVDRHYRELVRPVDAEKWFSIRPEAPENVVALQSDVAATA